MDATTLDTLPAQSTPVAPSPEEKDAAESNSSPAEEAREEASTPAPAEPERGLFARCKRTLIDLGRWFATDLDGR
jgi:hypothetical protein